MSEPQNLELEPKSAEGRSTEQERAPEDEKYAQGAEILEVPSDGSFMQGLQTFISWVKTLVDDK